MNTSSRSPSKRNNNVNPGTKEFLMGWREWVSLPELGIPAIKAKIDTGARTSALHTFRIEPFIKDEVEHIQFWIHPLRKKKEIELVCEAPVIEKRVVKDSGGHSEVRYVICTPISIGGRTWDIEITLTDREDMIFRMLIGRTAIDNGHITINPSASYLYGRDLRKVYKRKR
jgi:hypothetical protein